MPWLRARVISFHRSKWEAELRLERQRELRDAAVAALRAYRDGFSDHELDLVGDPRQLVPDPRLSDPELAGILESGQDFAAAIANINALSRDPLFADPEDPVDPDPISVIAGEMKTRGAILDEWIGILGRQMRPRRESLRDSFEVELEQMADDEMIVEVMDAPRNDIQKQAALGRLRKRRNDRRK